MKRSVLSVVMMFFVALCAAGQEYMDAVLYLTGASAPEELDSEVVERFDALASRPLRINTATEARLVSSGLLSRYQAASLADYRRLSGDILSVAELALVDGFGGEAARALAPFVSFETQAPPGRSSLEKGRVTAEAMARSAVQYQEGKGTGSHALKVRVGDDDRWLLSLAAKQASLKPAWPRLYVSGSGSSRPPGTLSASAVIYGRRRAYKAVIGDFNARFGQGLLLWSGFSLSGVQSAAAMDRHPSGLSPAWTLSPDAAHRGAAADIAFGRVVLSGFWSAGKCFGANLTWLARLGHLGLTATVNPPSSTSIFTSPTAVPSSIPDLPLPEALLSADYRWSLGKFDIFGEAAGDLANRAVAFLAGAAWNPAYQVRIAASVRSYPAAYAAPLAGALRSSTRSSDERGASFAVDYKKLTITADAVHHPSKDTRQFKTIAKYSPQLTERLTLGLRAVSRLRPSDPYPWRNDVRLEAAVAAGRLSLKGCAAACRCADLSWLTYLEGGYINESSGRKLSFYLRGTAFKVDRWEDRIYIYERDVPGSFSVPAYYGRGCSASAVASVKRRHLSLHARAHYTAYPGMAGQKPSRAGLKLQLQLSF
jgi:hypothetical protein